MGYTSVFVDTDSDDWKQPGVSKIIKWATPKKNKGASVLFHDAGGNRAQTVKALGDVHQEDEGEGLHLHHGQRRHRGQRRRTRRAARTPAGRPGPAQQPGSAQGASARPGGRSAPAASSGQQGQQPGQTAGRNSRAGRGVNSLQAAHRTATGTTLYEGKALIAAVAVAEWTVPGLATGSSPSSASPSWAGSG